MVSTTLGSHQAVKTNTITGASSEAADQVDDSLARDGTTKIKVNTFMDTAQDNGNA